MSGTMSGLRRQISGAQDLQSVVRTMKAVSASNIGQYENSLLALADYQRSVELGLGACLRNAAPRYATPPVNRPPTNAPAGDRSPTGPIVAVVFGSDQGLVGQFNATISDFAAKTVSRFAAACQVWAVGERVHEQLSGAGLPVSTLFTLPASIKGIVQLVGDILVAREDRRDPGDALGLYVFYNRPGVGDGYSPTVQRLLPLDHQRLDSLRRHPWPNSRYAQIIGENTATLRTLVNEFLFVSIFRACAESLASEHAGRLAAMERADRNIDELLKTLNGTYHQVRKARIDAELFDVIAAFDL